MINNTIYEIRMPKPTLWWIINDPGPIEEHTFHCIHYIA